MRKCLVCGAKAKRPSCSFDYDCPLCSGCMKSLDKMASEADWCFDNGTEVAALVEWAAKRALEKGQVSGG